MSIYLKLYVVVVLAITIALCWKVNTFPRPNNSSDPDKVSGATSIAVNSSTFSTNVWANVGIIPMTFDLSPPSIQICGAGATPIITIRPNGEVELANKDISKSSKEFWRVLQKNWLPVTKETIERMTFDQQPVVTKINDGWTIKFKKE